MREARGFRLTARDRSIVADVTLSNVLSIGDLVRLGYFRGLSRARRRMAALLAEGYVRRAFVAGESQGASSVFMPGTSAADIVSGRFGLEPSEIRRRSARPFARTLAEHSSLVTLARVALTRGGTAGVSFAHEVLARHEYSATEAGRERRHLFKPDARLEVGRLVAYLEADRGSVSVGKWAATVAGYRRYFRLGLFGGEHPGSVGAVLVVVNSGHSRIAAMARATRGSEAPPFYFARAEEIESGGPNARVWVREPGGEKHSFLGLGGAGPC